MSSSLLKKIREEIKEISNKARVKIEEMFGIENYYRVNYVSELEGEINTGEYYFTLSLLRRSTNERIEMEYKYDINNKEVKLRIKTQTLDNSLITYLLTNPCKEKYRVPLKAFLELRSELKNKKTLRRMSLSDILNITQKYFDPEGYRERIINKIETLTTIPYKWR